MCQIKLNMRMPNQFVSSKKVNRYTGMAPSVLVRLVGSRLSLVLHFIWESIEKKRTQLLLVLQLSNGTYNLNWFMYFHHINLNGNLQTSGFPFCWSMVLFGLCHSLIREHTYFLNMKLHYITIDSHLYIIAGNSEKN